MPLDDRVIDQVASELGRYVYVLVDPRDSRPFYVGKGQGLRFLSHDRAAPETLDEDEGPKPRVFAASGRRKRIQRSGSSGTG